jgi:hypothetical protein
MPITVSFMVRADGMRFYVGQDRSIQNVNSILTIST